MRGFAVNKGCATDDNEDANHNPQIKNGRARSRATALAESVVAPLEFSFAEETIIVLLEELGFNLAHHIEHHTHHDQKRGATEELED